MTKEEHNALINNIRTCDNEVERNTMLLNLVTDYDTMLTESDANRNRIEVLEKENNDYAKLNNQLFIQISGNSKPADPENNDGVNMPPKRNFSDLKFD